MKIVIEKNMDGTGPEGKGAKTGRGKGKCEGTEYEKFYSDTLKKFAKDFGKKASIGSFSDEEKKKFFDYIDKNWTAQDEGLNDIIPMIKKMAKKPYDIGLKIAELLSNGFNDKDYNEIRDGFMDYTN